MSDPEDPGDLAAREPEGLWLRCRGLGRDRLVRYLCAYLENLGYSASSSEATLDTRSVTRLEFILTRSNPAVPSALSVLILRVLSTGGGSLIYWDHPRGTLADPRVALLRRFVEEFVAHLAREVSTASRGTAKLTAARPDSLPFDV